MARTHKLFRGTSLNLPSKRHIFREIEQICGIWNSAQRKFLLPSQSAESAVNGVAGLMQLKSRSNDSRTKPSPHISHTLSSDRASLPPVTGQRSHLLPRPTFSPPLAAGAAVDLEAELRSRPGNFTSTPFRFRAVYWASYYMLGFPINLFFFATPVIRHFQSYQPCIAKSRRPC